MATRLFKEMYLRGTIEGPEDFPKFENRVDGHVYKLELSADTSDPESGALVSPVLATGDVVVKDSVNHFDPLHADYCVIDGSLGVATDLTTDAIFVGSQVIIDGDVRYIKSITSATEFTINYPLSVDNTAVTTATTFNVIKSNDNAVVGAYVEPSHKEKRAPKYGEITGVGTLFTTEFMVGDVVEINGEKRAIKSIASDTVMVLESALNSDVTIASSTPIYLVKDGGFNVEVKTGTVETETVTYAIHSTYVNTDYKVVKANVGSGTGFITDLTLQEGDKVIFFKDFTAYERVIISLTETVMTLDRPISGNIDSIDTPAEAISLFKSSTGQVFADNSPAFIMWLNGEWVKFGDIA